MSRTISIDDLRLVLAVGTHGSFVAAARRLAVPTSTISRAVARLEEELGVRLFQRTSRHVSLTDEGARLVERAAPLLEQLADVLDDVPRGSLELAGRLRVTAPLVTGANRIAHALLAFAEAHPQVALELSLSNAVVDLVHEGFDLAFRGGPIHDSELVARKLWSAPYVVAASPAFLGRELGERTVVERAELEALPAILPHPDATWRFVGDDGKRRELEPSASLCVNDLRVAVEAARRGLGVVRAPREHAEAAGLVALTCHELGTPEPRDLYAVYPSRRFVPKRVRMAIEWVARSEA